MKKVIWFTVAMALGLGLTVAYKKHTEKEKAKDAALIKLATDLCNHIDTKFIRSLRESKKAGFEAFTVASNIKREVRKTEADGRLGAEAEVMINTAVNAVYRAKETETVERTQNIARYICMAELIKLYTKKTPQ